MLYRLDYIGGGAVRDRVIGGDLITRHMQTARRRAIESAAEANRSVVISRIGKAGAMRETLIVHPDGSTRRPMKARPANPREACKRDRGACFCTACRAERKAARA